MRTSSKTINITTGPITSQLLHLMWPIFLSFLCQQLYGISNSLIVGRFAGKEALGGIQVTAPLMDLAIALSLGIGAGCGVIVGQYFGEKNKKLLSESVHTAMALSIVGGIVMSVLGLLVARPVLIWMKTPENLMGEAMGFASWYFGAFMFSIILNMGSAIMRAVGDSKTPSIIIGSTCLVNVTLDLIFVAWLGMEAPGCGIATALSLVYGAIVVFAYLVKTNSDITIDIKRLKINPKLCIIMLKTGIPLGIQAGVYSVSNMIAQSAVNAYGTDTIAAWGLSGRINGVIWMVADSLGIAVTTFCAQNFGARNYQRMRDCLRTSLLLSVFGIGALSGIVFMLAPLFSQLFINDPHITNICAWIVRFIVPFIILYTTADCFSGIIRATGESLRPMILTIVGTCVLRIIWLELIVPYHNTLEMILAGYPMSWFITAGLFYIYYRHGSWLTAAEVRTRKNKEALEASLST